MPRLSSDSENSGDHMYDKDFFVAGPTPLQRKIQEVTRKNRIIQESNIPKHPPAPLLVPIKLKPT